MPRLRIVLDLLATETTCHGGTELCNHLTGGYGTTVLADFGVHLRRLFGIASLCLIYLCLDTVHPYRDMAEILYIRQPQQE